MVFWKVIYAFGFGNKVKEQVTTESQRRRAKEKNLVPGNFWKKTRVLENSNHWIVDRAY